MVNDQHFLNDLSILGTIVKSANLTSKDVVLEIGPGRGSLTRLLSSTKARVIAVEIDTEFKKYLDSLPVEVIYGNALDMIGSLEFNKVVSNLPYSISEPFFKKLIKLDIDLVVLMVGVNFFNLFSSKSKWEVIGLLFFDMSKVCEVSRDSFEPRPRTDSVVVRFKRRRKKLSFGEKLLKEFVLQDDKKVKNALREAFVKASGLTKKKSNLEVSGLNINNSLLEKNVGYLSNEEFRFIYEKIVDYTF